MSQSTRTMILRLIYMCFIGTFMVSEEFPKESLDLCQKQAEHILKHDDNPSHFDQTTTNVYS